VALRINEEDLLPLVIPETISLVVPGQHFVAEGLAVFTRVMAAKEQLSKFEGRPNICLRSATVTHIIDT